MKAQEATLTLERKIDAGSITECLAELAGDIEAALDINRMRAPNERRDLYHNTGSLDSIHPFGGTIVDFSDTTREEGYRASYLEKVEEGKRRIGDEIRKWPKAWCDGCLGWRITIWNNASRLDYVFTDDALKDMEERRCAKQAEYDRGCAEYYASKGSDGYCGD